MDAVRLTDVSRVFGRSYALHRVTATLEAGTATVLLGENGAGKTTLLNILATLDRPTSGSVRFGERSFDQFAREQRHHVGWVSHDALVYDDLTGRENLAFYARMYGLDSASLPPKWLERVGLTEAGDQRVREYSRGMRQRLSVARALLHDPKVVLLDEPLTGLDRGGRATLLDVFAELKQRGCVVVMITHDLHISDDFVDNVLVLKRGKMTFFGPSALLDAFARHA